ncbi:MAG TPA: hypothetical protein VFX30_06260 [bacterium]|nr:hypothetical protein [bacterium]
MASSNKRQNLQTIRKAIERLGPLANQVVLLGGGSTELLLTDPGAPTARKSDDVDVIAKLETQTEYYAFADLLRQTGFTEDTSPDAPICRWKSDTGDLLDIIPTSEDVFGFGNRWCGPALANAEWIDLSDTPGLQIRVRRITAPYFIATKLEAFDDRGNGDYQASHDMEDIIAVIDGRPEIIDDTLGAPKDLQDYLKDRFKRLLKTNKFLEALPGHLPPDDASQKRLSLVIERIRSLANL